MSTTVIKGTRARRRVKSALEETAHWRAGIQLDASPVDILQETLDLRLVELRFVQAQVEKIARDEFWRDTMVGRIPNEWIRYRNELMDALVRQCDRMVASGLMDRLVAVEETKTALFMDAFKAAAATVGLNSQQQQAFGAAFRDELLLAEGVLEGTDTS